MNKQICLGKIDFRVNFLRFLSLKKVASKPQSFLIARSRRHSFKLKQNMWEPQEESWIMKLRMYTHLKHQRWRLVPKSSNLVLTNSQLNHGKCRNKQNSSNTCIIIRVSMIVTIHNYLLTQWKHIPMGQFGANIFLIWTTSNYLWASEVFKNLSFKSQLFSSSEKKTQIEIMA